MVLLMNIINILLLLASFLFYGSVDEKSGKSKNIFIFLIVHMNTHKCLYIRLLIIHTWINGETFRTFHNDRSVAHSVLAVYISNALQ
jgi:hypothetical protein